MAARPSGTARLTQTVSLARREREAPALAPAPARGYAHACPSSDISRPVDYLIQRLWHETPIVPVEQALQHRIRVLLRHLGDPQVACPAVHVTGSAGKGSTATMIAAILRAAGIRTGLYTKPHLQTFIERFDVDGALMPPERFADLVFGMQPLVAEMLEGHGPDSAFGRPSLVEVAFAAGMRHFADERCDAVVIEAGLGGRTDYTNVFDHAPVRVITSVELEHRERLGGTRAAIAREKAAIIHEGETVVSGVSGGQGAGPIAARARETGSRLWRLGHEIALSEEGNGFAVECPAGRIDRICMPIPGAHQRRNAALAVASALAFADAPAATSPRTRVRRALAGLRLPGRWEVVQKRPRVILDGAHNPIEAQRLAETFTSMRGADGSRLILVCGILGDKDQAPMVRAFASVADSVVVTQPPLAERTGDPSRMLALFRRRLGAARVAFEPDPLAALDLALAQAAPG